MKTLLLLRHAKAQPGANRDPDRERSLTDRGHRNSQLVGIAVGERWLPDLILCSPSVRTVETMHGIIATLPKAPEVILDESLYGGGVSDYVSAIAKNGGRAETLLVIGHNPAIHETAVGLVRTPDARMSAKFPTSALAVIAFTTEEWTGIRAGAGDLVRFLRPKDLGAPDAGD